MLATNQLPKNIASSAVLLRVPVDISPVLNSVIAGRGFRLRNLSVSSPGQQFTIVVTPKVACVRIQSFKTSYASSQSFSLGLISSIPIISSLSQFNLLPLAHLLGLARLYH
jgi:hypothetical protein